MDFQDFTQSRLGVFFGMALGRLLPQEFSYRLSDFIAGRLAQNKDSPMVQAVRANQWVARGECSTSEELDAAVREVFAHAGRCFADLYRNLNSPVRLQKMSPASEDSERLVSQSQDRDFGALIVAPHLSNFDIVALANAYRGLKGRFLAFGNPTGGYKLQNRIRVAAGLEVTPIDSKTLRQAITYLRNGGFVFTGVDRPVSGKGQQLSFFGRPSPVPTGHIRLALAADVPIVVAATQMRSDGRYYVRVSEPLRLERHHDTATRIRINGEAVLRVVEGYIREKPSQWLMYYPVWPAVLQQGV